jgi:hypothetical protein
MSDNSRVITNGEPNQLIENVRNWTILDNNLRVVLEKTKQMREMKRDLTAAICKYMQDRNKVNATIGISDGELRIYTKTEYSGLTFGYVEQCLAEIIPDKSHVEFIMKYLKDHREVSSGLDIRRSCKKDALLK